MSADPTSEAVRLMAAAYDAARENPITGDASLDVFLRGIPEASARLAQDLAVPHWFDWDVAGALAPPGWDRKAAAQRAASLPFVLVDDRGFRYHDSARKALRQPLLEREPDRVRAVCRQVDAVLAGRDPELEVQLERLFCALAFDGEAGMDRLFERFREARKGYDLATCHQLLALGHEQAPLLSDASVLRLDYMRGLLELSRHDNVEAERVLRGLKLRPKAADRLPKLDLNIGIALDAQARWHASARHYRSALKELRKRRREVGRSNAVDAVEARLHHRLAFALLNAGKLGKAEQHVRRSLERNVRAGDTNGQALNHELLGQIHLKLGSHGRAEQHCRASLSLLDEVGDVSARGRVLNHLAGVFRLREEYDEARRIYEQAIESRRAIGDSFGVAVTQLNLGALEVLAGRPGAAADCYRNALRTFEQIRHSVRVAEAYQRLAALRYDDGERQDAIALLEQAASIAPDASDIHRSIAADLRRYRRFSAGRYGRLTGVFRTLLRLLRRSRAAASPPGV